MGQTAIISPQILDSTQIGRDLIAAADQAAAQAILGVTGVDTGEDYTWTGDHTFDGSVTFTDTFDAVDGSYTGNLTSEVGGSYRLYNLGDSSATDQEYLDISATANVFKIGVGLTNAGEGRTLRVGSGNSYLQMNYNGSFQFFRGGSQYMSFGSVNITVSKYMQPSSDLGTKFGSATRQWLTGYFGSVVASGNLVNEVGGSYKLYNLGDESAADSEFLSLETDSNNFRILSNLTGAGVQRDIRLGGYVGTAYRGIRIQPASGGMQFIYNNANRLSINSTTTTIGTSTTKTQNLQPSATGSYSNGTDSFRWSNVASVDGDFSGSLTTGGLRAAIVGTLSSSVTLTTSDHTLLCDATSNDITVNLPTAVGIDGQEFVIKKDSSGSNKVTIDPDGSEVIDGSATYDISTAFKAVRIQAYNGNWHITG